MLKQNKNIVTKFIIFVAQKAITPDTSRPITFVVVFLCVIFHFYRQYRSYNSFTQRHYTDYIGIFRSDYIFGQINFIKDIICLQKSLRHIAFDKNKDNWIDELVIICILNI